MHCYSDKPTFATLADIKDKKVTIMGLGLNGGGEASVRFFSKYGAYITITDMKTKEELQKTLDSLENDNTIDKSRITYHLGEHLIEDFENADVVIKNPGVKYQGNKFLAKAKAIETDLSIFLHFTKAPIIAVTGSKGKSSTVSAIHYGLQKAGFQSFLGGNITVSPLTFLEETTSETPVVLELSSWQLSDLRGRKLLKPKISLITKIVPDHQNWYGSMENYVADKKLIYADQTEQNFTICDYSDNYGKTFAQETKGTVYWYNLPQTQTAQQGITIENQKGLLFDQNQQAIILDELQVPGIHMRQNVSNAALVLYLYGIQPETIPGLLKDFPGIPHRLEAFHQYTINEQKVTFYNDSAATVPEATAAALLSFSGNSALICGGTDKELDFEPLEKVIDTAKSIFLLDGTGTAKLLPFLKEKNIAFHGPYNNLDQLLQTLKEYLAKQENIDRVIFSPGATSFGMFKNEFDRGNTFKEKVKIIFE